jgi:hypothetical protein
MDLGMAYVLSLSPWDAEHLSCRRAGGMELSPWNRLSPKLLDDVVVFKSRVNVLDNDPRWLTAVRDTLA